MNKFFVFFFLFISFSFPTEERNPHPFFKITGKKLEIILENLEVSICLIDSKDVFEYTLASKDICENIRNNAWDSVSKIIKEKPQKKEFIFQFFDKSNIKMKAQFSDEKNTYELVSMIYYKQEKTFYLELLDSEKNYYFFQVNPKAIRFKVKVL
ncbi:MAG: hypothetical protein N3A69_10500 [Leptospiraceae bacterium]|nr:hypothetical protein [Leptospiraceae bacterium]